ncbi:hypothetical protein [Aquisphaera insulae]|nr:hypothetical protein [Aquisphaera insulae]
MSGWSVTSPWIFFGVASVVVAYILFMMVARRKGERGGEFGRENDL